jgi:hypothetical protein
MLKYLGFKVDELNKKYTLLISVWEFSQFPYCINKISPNHPDEKIVRQIEKIKQAKLNTFILPSLIFFSLNDSIVAIADVIIIRTIEIKKICQVSLGFLTIELSKYINVIKITAYILI